MSLTSLCHQYVVVMNDWCLTPTFSNISTISWVNTFYYNLHTYKTLRNKTYLSIVAVIEHIVGWINLLYSLHIKIFLWQGSLLLNITDLDLLTLVVLMVATCTHILWTHNPTLREMIASIPGRIDIMDTEPLPMEDHGKSTMDTLHTYNPCHHRKVYPWLFAEIKIPCLRKIMTSVPLTDSL